VRLTVTRSPPERRGPERRTDGADPVAARPTGPTQTTGSPLGEARMRLDAEADRFHIGIIRYQHCRRGCAVWRHAGHGSGPPLSPPCHALSPLSRTSEGLSV